MSFMAAEVGMAQTPENQDPENSPLQLVFQSGHMDASSVFTRQATDGELDVTDPEVRLSTKSTALSGIILQSQTLSSTVIVRQHHLRPLAIPSGSRPVLYRRLII